MKKTITISLSIFLVIAAAAAGGLWYINSPPGSEVSEYYFRIEEGANFIQIADALRARGIIRSRLFLLAVSRLSGTDTLVQSGSYALPSQLTSVEILRYISSGQQLLARITIPEGLTIKKIAPLIEAAKITDAEAFISAASDSDILAEFSINAGSAEGYLFPDTYLFTEDADARDVVRHMLGRFFQKIAELSSEYGTDGDAASSSLSEARAKQLHELVVLASMVEKEYINPPEAPLIASVFHNRLARNMRLEACSTIVYIITEIEMKPHPDRIFFQDLERSSPYNTYRNAGLPPSPIANPGTVALSAALNPAESNYLYFVLEHEQATSHTFSETFSEHNQARTIFLHSRR